MGQAGVDQAVDGVVELWRDGQRLARQNVLHPPGGTATFIFDGSTSVSGYLTETRIEGEQVVMKYDVAPVTKPPAVHLGK